MQKASFLTTRLKLHPKVNWFTALPVDVVSVACQVAVAVATVVGDPSVVHGASAASDP